MTLDQHISSEELLVFQDSQNGTFENKEKKLLIEKPSKELPEKKRMKTIEHTSKEFSLNEVMNIHTSSWGTQHQGRRRQPGEQQFKLQNQAQKQERAYSVVEHTAGVGGGAAQAQRGKMMVLAAAAGLAPQIKANLPTLQRMTQQNNTRRNLSQRDTVSKSIQMKSINELIGTQ